MKTLLLIIILVSILLSLLTVLKSNHHIQILPSLCWTSFMTIPLYLTWDYYDLRVLKYQFVGVIIIHFFFVLTDVLTIRLIKRARVIDLRSPEHLRKRIILILLIATILIPAAQYFQSSSFLNLNLIERENFNKLDSPYALILLSMLTVFVLLPFISIDAFNKKRYLLATALIAWASFYLATTGAKGNFVLFVGGILVSYALLGGKTRNRLISGLFLLSFISIVILGIHSIRSTENITSKCEVPQNTLSTPGNLLRLDCSVISSFNQETFPNSISLGYRLILTPIEVSYYWYDFTLLNSIDNRPISNLFDRKNESKLSNKIGLKYFVEPFPDSYSSTINANASIDADAFSFHRFYSVIFVALIYSFIRVFIGIMSVHPRPSIRILSGLGLSKLILLPFSAGLQAILVPHGLALIIILILLLNSNYANSKIFK